MNITGSSRPTPLASVPTGDLRHCVKLREGAISGEVFGKARLAKIPVDPDVIRERELGNEKYTGGERVTVQDAQMEKQKAAKVRVGRPGQTGRHVGRRRKKAVEKRQVVQKDANKGEKTKALKKKGSNGKD